MIDLFHFLRPAWLLVVPVTVLTWWLVRRREAQKGQLGEFVAAHLREALTVNHDNRGGWRAVDGVSIAVLLLALAAAGPTWSRQASPWFSETAPVVVAIEVSDSMRSNDLQPTRLDRARFKVLDLVAARTGSRTALIAYAGSAHVVLPPTTDRDVIKPFLEGLDPAIMPLPGADATAVLLLARSLLGDQAAYGTLLFVNDGFTGADVDALAAYTADNASPAVAALVVGTDEGGVAFLPDGSPVMAPGGGRLDTRVDTAVLRRVAGEGNVAVVRASSGNDDIRELQHAIRSNLEQADDPDARWQDQGWWLLWPAMLLALLWFRRGWTMQW